MPALDQRQGRTKVLPIWGDMHIFADIQKQQNHRYLIMLITHQKNQIVSLLLPKKMCTEPVYMLIVMKVFSSHFDSGVDFTKS